MVWSYDGILCSKENEVLLEATIQTNPIHGMWGESSHAQYRNTTEYML